MTQPTTNTMAISTKSKASTFRVLYNFDALDAKELTVRKGDILLALGEEDHGWLRVKPLRHDAATAGLVPFSYLKPSTVIARPPPPKAVPTRNATDLSSSSNDIDCIVRNAENAAVEYAECGICFNAMISRKPACFLLKLDERRVCRHYFHRSCVDRVSFGKTHKACAICATSYESAKDVPDFEVDPEGFFEAVDFDHNYKLNKGEVVSILKALVDLDWRAVEKNVDQFWAKWDHNGDGTLSFKEMMHPRSGLIQYVRATYPLPKTEKPYPKLSMSNAKEFFHFWDEDKSGTLGLEEIVRALVKTFHKGDTDEAENIRMVLSTMWHVIDHDGSGFIEEHEFCKAGGLCEMLVVNYTL